MLCAAAFFADFSLLHARAAFALRSLCRDNVVDAEEQARRLSDEGQQNLGKESAPLDHQIET